MKKIVSIMAAFMISVSIGGASDKLDAKTLSEIKASHKLLNTPNIVLKEGKDLGSVYFLKVEHNLPQGKEISYAFFDKTSQSLYAGVGYTKTGEQLKFPKDAQAIKEGISFSYGKGSKEIYVITDPECPYCKKFEKETFGKLSDYRVHVILFPLSFHKKAPVMVEWIMQGKDGEEKQKRLQDITINGSKEYLKLDKKDFKYSDSVKEMIGKAQVAFAELEARGTPAVFDDKYAPISWDKLVAPNKSDK